MDGTSPTPAIESALRDVAWVQGLARRLAREGDAEDLAQETWLAALESPGRARAGLRQWLSGVARHLALRQRRAARPEASDALDQRPGAGGTDELVLKSEFQERVLAAVRALAEPYRATVLLRYYEGLALDEVARRTGVPSSTARTRLARAHEELRRRLDHEWGRREAWCALAVPGMNVTTSVVLGGSAMKAVSAGVGVVLVALAGYVGWEVLRDGRGPEKSAQARALESSASAEPVGESGPSALEESAGVDATREELASPPASVEPPAPASEGSGERSSREEITIRGRVVDPEGQPLAGANLYAIPPDASDWSSRPDRVSNEQGEFELRGLARGLWKVGAHNADARKPAEAVIDARDGDVQDVQLVLTRGGCLTGRVSWPDGSHVALASYKAELEWPGGSSSSMGTFRDGVLDRCGLEGEGWSLEVTAQRELEFGHLRREGLTLDTEELELVLETIPTFGVRVVITDPAGTPIETTLKARSTLHEVTRGWPKLTRGPAVLEGVFPDAWKVELWAIGFRSHSEEVVISSAADTLTFSLDPIEPVRGRVLDPQGRPAAGARILEGYGRGRESQAASDGTFELAGMPCRLHLTATLPGFAPSESVAFEHTGEKTTNGPVLVLRSAHRAAGRVLDANGNPVDGITVESPLFGCEDKLTTSAGTFEFIDLPAGTHTLWLTRPDGTKAGPYPFSVGETPTPPLELRLPAPE